MDLGRNEEGNRRASLVWDQLFFLPKENCNNFGYFYYNLRSQILFLLRNVTLRKEHDFIILCDCQCLNTFVLMAKITKMNSRYLLCI